MSMPQYLGCLLDVCFFEFFVYTVFFYCLSQIYSWHRLFFKIIFLRLSLHSINNVFEVQNHFSFMRTQSSVVCLTAYIAENLLIMSFHIALCSFPIFFFNRFRLLYLMLRSLTHLEQNFLYYTALLVALLFFSHHLLTMLSFHQGVLLVSFSKIRWLQEHMLSSGSSSQGFGFMTLTYYFCYYSSIV